MSSIGLHGLRRVAVVPGVELVEASRARASARRGMRAPRSHASMFRAAFLPCPTRDRDRALRRHHVAAGEDARRSPSSCCGRPDRAVRRSRAPARLSSSERSTSWPSASTSESASSVSNSPVGCGKPLASSAIFSTVNVPSSLDALDRRQPLDHHAFLQRFLELEIVRGHLLARAPVDDDRFAGAQPLGRARDVERRVAAAVDDDAAAQHAAVPRPPCCAAPLPRRACAPRRAAGM